MSTRAEPKQSDVKRAAIVDAATATFLSQGFELTSMDAIAALANVSKRTVYNHFPSKLDLFRAVTSELYAELLEAEKAMLLKEELPGSALPRLGRALLEHLRKPQVTGLLRLVIAEQHRLPEIATEFYAGGKGPACGLLEDYLSAQSQMGRLSITDPLLAAQQFLGMIKESLFWPAMLGLPTKDNENAVVEKATAMILETYRADTKK